MSKRPIDIIIKATDHASPVFDRVGQRAEDLNKRIASVASRGAVSKISRIASGISDHLDSSAISSNFDKERLEVYGQFKARAEEIRIAEAEIFKLGVKGLKNDKARSAALLFQRDLEKDIYRLRKDADALIKRGEEIDKAERIAQRKAGFGRAAGALMIAEAGGQILQKFASDIDDINERAEKLNATGAEYVGEIARAIPGVGTLAKGFDKIRDSAWDVQATLIRMGTGSEKVARWFESGAAALRRANKEAAEIEVKAQKARAQIAAEQERRDRLNKMGRVDPTGAQKIIADRDAELEKIDKEQAVDVHGNTRQAADEARARVNWEAAKELARLQDDEYAKEQDRLREHHGQIEADRREAADITAQMMIESLREQGRTLEAELLSIRTSSKRELDSISRDRDALDHNTEISVAERLERRAALDDIARAVEGRQQQQEEAAREKSRRREEEERAKAANIRTEAEKEIADAREEIEKRSRSEIAVTQGTKQNAAVDARTAGSGALAQRSQVEVIQKQTADNTKKIADLNEKIRQLLEKIAKQGDETITLPG